MSLMNKSFPVKYAWVLIIINWFQLDVIVFEQVA